MVSAETDYLDSQLDLERRRELGSFLMQCRSRLEPTELGLPRTGRRRVRGLRRDEVAELIGVSVDWYRSFESGRPIRVSPQLVSRLSKALRLTGEQQFTLFRLSLPDLSRRHVGRDMRVEQVESGSELGVLLRTLRRRVPRDAASLGSWKRLPARRGRRVTQEEIAEAVGVSRNWYRMLESGARVRASTKLLDRIANAFAFTAQERLELFVLAIPELGRECVPVR
jgi:transcriptional regulator with XRE-family HTH domain